MLPQLIKYFNENEAILIKNFPNPMLSEEQLQIKEKLISFDRAKEESKILERFRDNMTEAAERGEKMVCKIIPHEYSEQMRQAMLYSGICFVPFTTEKGYLNIVVLEKDKDAFLQVQTSVFKKESLTVQNLQEEQIKNNDKKPNENVEIGEER